MKPLLIRERGTGYVVGEAYLRERHGKPAIEARRPRYARTPEELARIVERALAQAREGAA